MVASLDDFEKQKKAGFFTCPLCGSSEIEKALSAPYVLKGKQEVALPKGRNVSPEQLQMMLRTIQEVAGKAENVGEEFAQEARLIHSGEKPDRPIKGTATKEEVEDLLNDGIPVVPIPNVKPETIN